MSESANFKKITLKQVAYRQIAYKGRLERNDSEERHTDKVASIILPEPFASHAQGQREPQTEAVPTGTDFLRPPGSHHKLDDGHEKSIPAEVYAQTTESEAATQPASSMISIVPPPISLSGQQAQSIDFADIDAVFKAPKSQFAGASWRPLRGLAAFFESRRRIPVLTQMSATECGAACLAMILTYYGYQTSISEVSTECGVGRDGLSAKNIVKAARRYGLQAAAATVEDIEDFEQIDLPAIVHWQFNHFIIVERWSAKQVEVVDPAIGRRTLSMEEFDNGFTGVALILQPGPQFIQHKGPSRLTLLRIYILNTLKLAPPALFQVLLASLILLVLGLAMPATTAVVINNIMPHSLNNLLLLFGLGMTCILIAQTALSYVRSIVLIKLQARIDTSLMVGFFDHLLSLPLRYFQLRSNGDLLNRLGSNAAIRDTFNARLIASMLDTVAVIVYLAILIRISPVFALVAFLFGIAQMVVMVSTNQAILALFKRSLEAQGKSQGYLTEMLVNLTTVKASGAEKHVRGHWLRLFFAEMSASVQRDYLIALVTAIQSIIRSLAPIVLLLVGAQQVIAGTLQIGTMLALLSLATSFLTPLEALVDTGQQLQQTYAHLERITDVMKAEPEQHNQQPNHPPRLTGHIQLVNVGFQYDKNTVPILHDINLTILPGQKVAIVGRSGAGKSTLGKLLLGLYQPTQGEIFYDKIPLHAINYQEVRAQFGVVTQDIGIFNGSIRENIAFNTPGIDLADIIVAAQAAAIHDDIMRTPMEYETIVSEGGNAISGGQRQRLALARALVRNPAILLLDEATSSLDVATEQVIERNLSQLSYTQIIIAHRLSTIRNADLILAVDNGTIVEQGTHEELLKRQGFYARLIVQQLANGDIRTERAIQPPK